MSSRGGGSVSVMICSTCSVQLPHSMSGRVISAGPLAAAYGAVTSSSASVTRCVLYGGSSETSDYDGDGLTDYEEAKVYGTSLSTPDSDGDQLGDYNEATDFGTDPNDSDTDDDGYSDGFEINDGYDPFDPADPGLLN